MKRFLGVLLTFLLAFWFVWGAIYYDPDTNSYVTTDPNAETQEDDDQTDDGETTWDVEDDEDDSILTGDEAITGDIVPDNPDYDGPLADLHEQLDTHTENLLDQLEAHYEDLQEMSQEAQTGSGAVRFDVLKCLGLLETDMNFDQQLDTVYHQLRRQIGITQKDLHSDVTALEGKIEDDLLDAVNEKLEKSSLTNKVESYDTEFTNVVDEFNTVFEDYIAEADQLAEDASEEHANLLEGYDERVAAYRELEDAYDEFVSKSSFAGVVAWPNIQELYEVRDALKGYYASKLWSERHDQVVTYVPRFPEERAVLTTEQEELARDFQERFNEYADELLEGLYPVEDLLVLHKSVLSLRSAYTDQGGTLDCKAFANNKTIEVSGPQLQDYMDEVLSNLNKYANQVADSELPKDAEALKEGLAKWLAEKATNIINTTVADHKQDLRQTFTNRDLTLYSVPRPAQQDNEEKLVRTLLQEMYLKYFQQDELDTFNEKLADANSKIETALTKNISSKDEERLQMIQKIILEFL